MTLRLSSWRKQQSESYWTGLETNSWYHIEFDELKDVYDRIFSFCDCPFLAIVFLRFSALAGMAGRTSWWLKARRNYGQLSVFNLYLALHPDGALLHKCADGIHCMNPA